jgi:hypothetical protein
LKLFDSPKVRRVVDSVVENAQVGKRLQSQANFRLILALDCLLEALLRIRPNPVAALFNPLDLGIDDFHPSQSAFLEEFFKLANELSRSFVYCVRNEFD